MKHKSSNSSRNVSHNMGNVHVRPLSWGDEGHCKRIADEFLAGPSLETPRRLSHIICSDLVRTSSIHHRHNALISLGLLPRTFGTFTADPHQTHIITFLPLPNFGQRSTQGTSCHHFLQNSQPLKRVPFLVGFWPMV